ncbi:hypothetical protein [Nocardia crassostreae]|uniref:hypothetical protein n=1 Tax=Nocardia crassostreae TaxID=53428 RepID=UPI00082B84EE
MPHSVIPPFTVLRPGEGRHVPIPGFGADFKFGAHLTSGAVSMVEHPFAVGVVTPPHTHTFEDEYSIVLEDEIGFRSGDAETCSHPAAMCSSRAGRCMP